MRGRPSASCSYRAYRLAATDRQWIVRCGSGGRVPVDVFDPKDRAGDERLVVGVEACETAGDLIDLLPGEGGDLPAGAARAGQRATIGGGADEEAVGVAEHVLAAGVVDEAHGGGEEEPASAGDQGGDDRVEPGAGGL